MANLTGRLKTTSGGGIGSIPQAIAMAMAFMCLICTQYLALNDEKNAMPSFENNTYNKGVYMNKLMIKSMWFVLTAIGASLFATVVPMPSMHMHQA
ncbi:hypothetical protein [Pseudomonas sp. NPDC087615]|uniref:hypothetical protein n=1 Tax=Pseudomonas sp. NPDC087615 TaxID=3364443 RepID=UPI003825A53E